MSYNIKKMCIKSSVCGGYVEVFTEFSVQILAELIQNTEYFSNFVGGNHRYICFVSY